MPHKRILIIDDNPQNLKLTRVLLTGEGYDVRTAVDAEDAIKMIEDFPPQLILMDIQLPGMDGLQLTRKLKSDPSLHSIIIIALTAYAMKGDLERSLEAGCNAYVPKPIDIDELLQVIKDQLALHGSVDAPAVSLEL